MKTERRALQLKGSKGGLVAIIDSNSSLTEIAEELTQKLAEGGVFFQGASVRMDLGGRLAHPEDIDKIRRLFTEHGLVFAGVIPREVPGEVPEERTKKERKGEKETRALILRRTLRSGQKIVYKGSVVVLGDVNPGAEITAGGDIIVLGKLRGVVHAGVRGDESVSVSALLLEPSQLRIGKVLSRAPDEKQGGGNGPEWARVQGGRIIVSPLNKD
jgi:septum site-determining protein MinC